MRYGSRPHSVWHDWAIAEPLSLDVIVTVLDDVVEDHPYVSWPKAASKASNFASILFIAAWITSCSVAVACDWKGTMVGVPSTKKSARRSLAKSWSLEEVLIVGRRLHLAACSVLVAEDQVRRLLVELVWGHTGVMLRPIIALNAPLADFGQGNSKLHFHLSALSVVNLK